jgi:hypothetical protein
MSGKLYRGLTTLAALAIVAMASPARASFMISVTDQNSGQTVMITDNGAGDADATVGQITYAPPTGTFTNFDILGITANSNRTDSSATSGLLQISGTVIRTTATPSSAVSLLVNATDTDYIQPPTGPYNLDSSSSSTMTNTGGGDSLTFQSFGDDPNAAFGTGTPSGILTFTDNRTPFLGTPKSFSGDAPTTPFGATIPYALTSHTIITVGPSQTSMPIALRRVQFQGTTSVTPATVIPEPASVVLLSLGGLGLVGATRRRKAKVAEA